ncbi:MAG: SurA N-terminal domain-containing protein [Candidatus Omnitrophica bacterium]|nr:SurA N-terminal domain-containing protein [Candidatus Omnitrophota bacterium]
MFRQVLRLKKRQTIVLWLLVIVFVLPMILFFHAGTVSQSAGPGGAAGELFGHKISWEVFQEEYRFLQLSLRAQVGDIPEGLEGFLQQQTWERLMLTEEARRTQRVNNEDVAGSLRRQPQFQQNGRFVSELYFQYVRALGHTPQTFEARLRDELGIQKLIEQVRTQVQISEEELRRAYSESHEPVNDAEFAHDREAFREAVLARMQDEQLAVWMESLRARARLKSFVEPPAPSSP